MNQSATAVSGPPSAVCPPPSALQPLVLALALALRARAAFGLECVARIVARLREQIAWQRTEAEAIRQIDDAMEKAAPLLAECLRNDPAWKRKIVWEAWQQTHAATEARAAALAPACPAHLLADEPANSPAPA